MGEHGTVVGVHDKEVRQAAEALIEAARELSAQPDLSLSCEDEAWFCKKRRRGSEDASRRISTPKSPQPPRAMDAACCTGFPSGRRLAEVR